MNAGARASSYVWSVGHGFLLTRAAHAHVREQP